MLIATLFLETFLKEYMYLYLKQITWKVINAHRFKVTLMYHILPLAPITA